MASLGGESCGGSGCTPVTAAAAGMATVAARVVGAVRTVVRVAGEVTRGRSGRSVWGAGSTGGSGRESDGTSAGAVVSIDGFVGDVTDGARRGSGKALVGAASGGAVSAGRASGAIGSTGTITGAANASAGAGAPSCAIATVVERASTAAIAALAGRRWRGVLLIMAGQRTRQAPAADTRQKSRPNGRQQRPNARLI